MEWWHNECGLLEKINVQQQVFLLSLHCKFIQYRNAAMFHYSITPKLHYSNS
jgi:hypothetical protein